jgi:tRNA threonylcarbamoyladenosine biosynthesis protein TsaB
LPPDPIVLGFDTSAAQCAAAVVSGPHVLAHRVEVMEKGQAERLMPLLSAVLAEAGVEYAALAGIGVGTGPGNFTGVRISVAAARGLALGLGIPAIGVTGFESAGHALPPDVVCLIDARRGALWAGGGVAPMMIELSALPAPFAGRPLTGHRAAEVAALTGGTVIPQPVAPAVAIAHIAASRLGNPQPRPAPLYLRPADATLPAEPPPRILP